MIIRFAKELVSFYSPLLPPNDEEAPALEHGSGHRDLDWKSPHTAADGIASKRLPQAQRNQSTLVS